MYRFFIFFLLFLIKRHWYKTCPIMILLLFEQFDANFIIIIIPVFDRQLLHMFSILLVNLDLVSIVILRMLIILITPREAVIDDLKHVIRVFGIYFAVLHVESRNLHLNPVGFNKGLHLADVAGELIIGATTTGIGLVILKLIGILSDLCHHGFHLVGFLGLLVLLLIKHFKFLFHFF